MTQPTGPDGTTPPDRGLQPLNADAWPNDPNGAPREDDKSPEANKRRRELQANILADTGGAIIEPAGEVEGTDLNQEPRG